jgi:hypothetical protein
VPRWAEISAPPARLHGRGLLDTAIVLVLLSVFLLVASQRLLPLRGEAEAAHIQTTIGQLRAVLGLTAAEIIVRDGMDSLQALPGSNPILLLEEPPRNYQGEVFTDQRADISPGNWYFLPEYGQLGYRIRHPQYLDAPDPVADLRWRIELDRNLQLVEVFDLNQYVAR